MSKAQSIIEQFYQEEQARLSDEATFSPLDISISSADMALISTIAKRFNKDRSLLAREALSQALQDMFSALEPAERKMLAKESDELASSIAVEMAEDLGLPKLEVSGTNWVTQDKNCVKAERKAEKEKSKFKGAPSQAASFTEIEEEPITEAALETTEDVIIESPAIESTDEQEGDVIAEEESSTEMESTQNHESIFA